MVGTHRDSRGFPAFFECATSALHPTSQLYPKHQEVFELHALQAVSDLWLTARRVASGNQSSEQRSTHFWGRLHTKSSFTSSEWLNCKADWLHWADLHPCIFLPHTIKRELVNPDYSLVPPDSNAKGKGQQGLRNRTCSPKPFLIKGTPLPPPSLKSSQQYYKPASQAYALPSKVR